MDTIAAIQSRYGFGLPATYRALLEKGHLSPNPWENYLALQDCEWLSLEQIANYEFLDFQITSNGGYVPFAVSSRRDEFCWRLDWAEGKEPPIVFCERGESGFGYAPHFLGFLYRKLLEEFAGYGGIEQKRDLNRLQQAVDLVAPYLLPDWAGRLRGLSKRKFNEWKRGKYGELLLVNREELKAEISSQLAFANLDKKFVLSKKV